MPMPAYDFRCISCGTTFEVVRRIADSSDVACIECGSATKRVFTPVGVHFKGSGFYNTDSRKQAASPATAAPAKTEEPATKAGSCKSSDGSPACAGCPSAE